MEFSLEVPQKTKNGTTIDPAITFLCIYSKEMHKIPLNSHVYCGTVTITKSQNQPLATYSE
jgi:hypothetical protein